MLYGGGSSLTNVIAGVERNRCPFCFTLLTLCRFEAEMTVRVISVGYRIKSHELKTEIAITIS